MPLKERERELHRKQRRARKLRELKSKLIQTQDREKRRKILEKIRKLSPGDPIFKE